MRFKYSRTTQIVQHTKPCFVHIVGVPWRVVHRCLHLPDAWQLYPVTASMRSVVQKSCTSAILSDVAVFTRVELSRGRLCLSSVLMPCRR